MTIPGEALEEDDGDAVVEEALAQNENREALVHSDLVEDGQDGDRVDSRQDRSVDQEGQEAGPVRALDLHPRYQLGVVDPVETQPDAENVEGRAEDCEKGGENSYHLGLHGTSKYEERVQSWW